MSCFRLAPQPTSLLNHVLFLLFLVVFRTESFLATKIIGFSRLFATFEHASLSADDIVAPFAALTARNLTIRLHHKPQQQRRPHTNRKPRGYWSNVSNLEHEVKEFWMERNLTFNFVLLPSESILYFYNRHDLRGAIASLGGREAIASGRPKFRVLPGRWADAVEQYPQLLSSAPELMNRQTLWDVYKQPDDTKRRWEHSCARKEKGYWNITTVYKELYNYTYEYRQQEDRPCIWMPRLSELAAHGRSDLKQAIQRFGGYDSICRRAGMISYTEWAYFEGQLCLLVELKGYLDVYHDGCYKNFPCVSDLERRGYKRLHSLIQYYGGRNFLSLKLGMVQNTQDHGGGNDMGVSFGAFDLELAVKLLEFVRSDQLRKSPPLKQYRVIAMPSSDKLRDRAERGHWMHAKICEYGGYENVARRLGLAI
ncbi:hypothetical protein MPSEU_000079400 [Mayamaea pseudoterrestris]|nr:hypothetical protein MPSEU_000079400 [Mayamaea pseudoterrestris]